MIGACTVLLPRVLVVSSVLNPSVALSLLTFILPAMLFGALVVILGWRLAQSVQSETAPGTSPTDAGELRNPLRLGAAIQMAIAFQVAMSVIAYVRVTWSTGGVYTTAALLGLTDMDALTVSMSRQLNGFMPYVAARAIAIGILANTVMKLTLVLVLGGLRFRRLAGRWSGGDGTGHSTDALVALALASINQEPEPRVPAHLRLVVPRSPSCRAGRYGWDRHGYP